jgi:hypothetical protein
MFDIRAHDTSAAAPGELELVQRFMNLHEHAHGVEDDLPPPGEMLEVFLKDRGLLSLGDGLSERDRATSLGLIRAFQAGVRGNPGEPMAD